MINIFRQMIERKLSSLFGAGVTLDDLDVSLLRRSATARGVRIAGDDSAEPLLAMRSIQFELSVGRMMHKQIDVKSLTLDHPVVHIVRREDGSWNLPDLRKSEPAAEDSGWRFDLRKVLLVEGRIDLRCELAADAAYGVELGGILGDLTREGDAVHFTLIAGTVRCGDRVIPGEARLSGTLRGVGELGDIAAAGVQAHLEIGGGLRVTVATDNLSARQFDLAVDLAAESGELLDLLPPIDALQPLRDIRIAGPVRVSTELRIRLKA